MSKKELEFTLTPVESKFPFTMIPSDEGLGFTITPVHEPVGPAHWSAKVYDTIDKALSQLGRGSMTRLLIEMERLGYEWYDLLEEYSPR